MLCKGWGFALVVFVILQAFLVECELFHLLDFDFFILKMLEKS